MIATDKITRLLAAAAVLMLAAGCTREPDLSLDPDRVGADEYALGMTLALENLSGNAETLSDDPSLESEVKDWRILVFTKEKEGDPELSGAPKFLFEVPRSYVQEIPKEEELDPASARIWHVSFNLSDIFGQRDAASKDKILQAIEKDGFKIVTLANWQQDVVSDGKISESRFTPDDYIYKLHYLSADTNYDAPAYKHLSLNKDDKMGVSLDWVTRPHENEYKARKYIMETFGLDQIEPSDDENEPEKYLYGDQYLWRVWRFGEWENKNPNDPNCQRVTHTGVKYPLADHVNEAGYIEKAFIDEKDPDRFEYIKKGTNEVKLVKDTPYGTGIVLETTCSDLNIGEKQKEDQQTTPEDADEDEVEDEEDETLESPWSETTGLVFDDKSNLFRFEAKADGHVHLKVAGLLADDHGEEDELFIGVHAREHDDRETEGAITNNKKRRTVMKLDLGNVKTGYTAMQDIEIRVEVTNVPINVDIFVSTDNPNDRVVLYEVEYINDRYLYDTYRTGWTLDDQLIPMYGVANFDPVDPDGDGRYGWGPGEVFELSHNEKGYKNNAVWLLRSVAKVELLIPTTMAPEYVFMRSMNRAAHCEPMDVSMQTWDSWQKIDEEIENVTHVGPYFYDGSPSKEESVFKGLFDWFYGSWTSLTALAGDPCHEAYRKENGGGELSIKLPNGPSTTPSSPRIFNPRVDRSDYTLFIHDGTRNGLEYYYLYLPDRHVDAPNKRGDCSETPKVPHIELRFKELNSNSNVNFNDDNHYRIYFAPNGGWFDSDEMRRNKNYEKTEYEKTLYKYKNIESQAHYPIVRNHIYRFTVTSLNAQGVQLQICSPAQRNVEIPEFE